jgi:hypothetical protein
MKEIGQQTEKAVITLAAILMIVMIVVLISSKSFTVVESKTVEEEPSKVREERIVKNNFVTVDGYDFFKATKDYEILKKIVYLEAKGEPLEGKKEVVRVILNRVESENFPNNIHDVVYQPKQFSPSNKIKDTVIKDGYLDEIELAILTVYTESKDEELKSDSLYFVNPKIADSSALLWMENSLTYSKTIGDHVFYE